MQRLDRRNRHELAIAEYFAQHLAATGVVLRNCRKGDEAAWEPDVLCELGDEFRGIEIVDCWLTEDDARVTWRLVEDLEERGIHQTVISSSSIEPYPVHPSGDPLVGVCQQQLDGHGVRRYGMPTWLVLNASQAPLHSEADGPRIVSWLKKPAKWRYIDAYLCLAQNLTWGRHFFRLP